MLQLKNNWLILGLILLLAFFLRVYNLGEKSFTADEFLGVNASYGYLQTGQWKRWDFNLEQPMADKPFAKSWFDWDIFHGGAATYTRAWLYHWQIAQALKFLPDAQEWSYRVVSVFWGMIAVLSVYFIAWKLTGRRAIGLMAAALLALSPDAIFFSRKVRMYAMFMPIFLWLSYAIFQLLEAEVKSKITGLKKIKQKTGLNLIYLPAVLILGLLAMHLHLLTANIALVVLVYVLAMAIYQWRKNQKWSSRYLVYFLLALIAVIGLRLIFPKVEIWGVYFTAEDHFSYLTKILADYTSVFLALILFFFGVRYFSKRKPKAGIFLLSSFLTILVMAIFFWNRNAGEQYIFLIKPFQVIILASGIYYLANYLKTNLAGGGKISSLVAVSLILILNNWAVYFSADGPYLQKSASENPDYRKVFGYVVGEKKPEEILVTRNFRNFYWQGSKAKVYTLGGERASKANQKIDLADLKKIMADNQAGGWIVFSDNDRQFFSKEAEKHMRQNLELISNSGVRGPVTVYHF